MEIFAVTSLLISAFFLISKIKERNERKSFEKLFSDIQLLAKTAKIIDPKHLRAVTAISYEYVTHDSISYSSISKKFVDNSVTAFVTLFIQELFYHEEWNVDTELQTISEEEWEKL